MYWFCDKNKNVFNFWIQFQKTAIGFFRKKEFFIFFKFYWPKKIAHINRKSC